MNAAAQIRAAGPALSPAWLPLLRELGDLKRIRSAGRQGSIAERLFRSAWIGLAGGAHPERVMLSTTANALAAARLGDLDEAKLLVLGLSPEEALQARGRSFDELGDLLDPGQADLLRAGLEIQSLPQGGEPGFVARLAEQPRAGVTCPGRPRLMLQPPENHAEHSLMVALYGVLISPTENADPTTVFLAGLAHHLHNAVMPDSGYAGEMLLGPHLATAIECARACMLDQLAPELRMATELALQPIATDHTPEARAFHAADAIDRVIEIEQHLAAARVTMAAVLDDYGLVHDGPVKGFHDHILTEVGLL